ncbi:MAG: hypothetical protein IK019_10150 [Clostridia bacterium]|nr:hypothetical protein [Clostridia bacterium]MBR6009181.1 hypothetical protein [Clostridia bacterium]
MKRVTLFAGHYGSGKSSLAVEYALKLASEGDRTIIADLDIVNPYFRSMDSRAELESAGVDVIVSPYAGSNVDVPALPGEMYRIVDDREFKAVVDVGGDDRGALALGRLSGALKQENDYEMILVVNFLRPLTQTPEEAAQVIREIEQAGSLPFTGIVNNTNLGELTTREHVLEGLEKAEKLSSMSGLKLLGSTVKPELLPEIKTASAIYPVRIRHRADWAIF